MRLATVLTPLVDILLQLGRRMDPYIQKLRVSRTGYENPRVRHMVGKTGYWLHAYRLTYPNIHKWLHTRGDLFPMVIQVQTIHPKHMSAEELTYWSFHARRTFNSPGSIFYRMFEFKTNMRNPLRLGVYLAYNPLFRKEVFKKQGLKLGH
jgi:hypothetical protein